jgi:hypothetical protein
MTTYGALGLGLASLACSDCGCDCIENCTCDPDSISFYMRAPEIDSLDYSCGSCAYTTPFLVTLDKELCDASYKYNINAATHWLYRDEESFCETPCDGIFGGTPLTFCFRTEEEYECGNSSGTGSECAVYTPVCSIACFSGSFSTTCHACTYVGFDIPALSDFSVQLTYEFRALMGNPSILFPGDTECLVVEDETPCVVFIVMFIKRYMSLNNDCTDLELIDVTRQSFYFILRDDCCGESTCEAVMPPDSTRIAACDHTLDLAALTAALAAFGGIPCYPSPFLVADPGHPEQKKLTVDCG